MTFLRNGMRAIFVAASFCGPMQIVHAAPPTPAELSAIAPRLSSDDAKGKSFHASGLLAPGSVKLVFDAIWLKPGRYAIRIFDGSDQTPLFWIVDGHALFYSPLDDSVNISDDTSADFEINCVTDKLNFNFGTRAHSRGKVPESIVIDVKSIIATASLNPSAAPDAGGGYELTGGTPRGSVLRARVDPARVPTFSDLKIFPKEDPLHPAFSLDKIEANIPDNPQAFRFPARPALAAQLHVQDFGEADSKATMNKLVVSITYRFAIHDPAAREQLEKQLGKIDWTAAAQKDIKASSILRQAMNDAPVVAESTK